MIFRFFNFRGAFYSRYGILDDDIKPLHQKTV